MKKITVAMFTVVMVFALASCGSNTGAESQSLPSESALPLETSQSEGSSASPASDSVPEVIHESSEDPGSDRILVAYFSRADEKISVGYIEKGNTEIVAEMISAQTGGTLFQIETVNPYPEKYDECKDVAQQEKNDNARPALVGNVENMDDYDVIFLGYPIWWGDMPMAVYTFLESYDFSGKTIVPFCTHEGSGISDTEQSIADACPGIELLDGLAIKGKTAQESREEASGAVTRWLRDNGLIE